MDNEVLDRIAAAIESLDKPGLPEMEVYRLTVALESTARNLDKLVALLVTPQTVTQAATAPQTVTQAEPEEKAVIQAAAPEAPGEEAPVVGRTRTEETLYRESLKKELREKGIAFKEAAKTTTLEKLVQAAGPQAPKVAASECCTPQNRTWATTDIDLTGSPTRILYCKVCGRVLRKMQGDKDLAVAEGETFMGSPAKAAEPEPEPSNVIAHTMDQVRGAIVGLAKVRGRDVAREILEKYGHATLIPEVDMQYYAAIIAKCEEAMKEGVRNAA
jgi:hypothetical protein